MSRRSCVAAVFLFTVATSAARGQIVAGGELENYLRYLQTVRLVPLYPWGMRAFSAAEAERLVPSDTTHPWVLPGPGGAFAWVDPTASARVNTTFPYGYNDGAIWAGRGVTLAAQGGFVARRGIFSLTVAPLAFVAQNAAFDLMPNGAAGDGAFADGFLPTRIDRPQRFGNTIYARLDPGQSTLRLDWRALAAGLTTANQYWGPASEFPVILGNNAPGFPHLFAGTSRPVDLRVVRIHGRLLWGRLSQSAFSPETAAAGVRLATGLVLDFTSPWVPGLEVGVTRISHRPWPAGGLVLDDLFHMFRGGQGGGTNSPAENQLASAFFRWVLPNSGFELYGEYGREDYNLTIRDFIEEPDHLGGYTIGFRKVLRRAQSRLVAVRLEVNNLQYSRLAHGRHWAPFYTHGGVRQGHTQLGQVLGAESGMGGAGSVAAVESFSPRGRWTASWTRLIRQQRGDSTGMTSDPSGMDVQHALAVERLQFRGRYALLARVSAIYELHRDFREDAFNLNLVLGVRVRVR